MGRGELRIDLGAATGVGRTSAGATEIRSTLLAAVGHDLRRPSTSIRSAANSLADPHLPLPDVVALPAVRR